MQYAEIKAIGANASNALEMFHEVRTDVKEMFQPLSYSQAEMYSLLRSTNRPIARNTLIEEMANMEAEGYKFSRVGGNDTGPYSLSHSDCIAIADRIGVNKYRVLSNGKAYVCFIQNLKGGVGKSLGTNMLATALVNLPKFLLKDIRVLIIDLDPQATSTQQNYPSNKLDDGVYTSIALMCEETDKEDIALNGIKHTAHSNIDIIPCSTSDGFYADKINTDEVKGDNAYQELLLKRIINKFEGDYDFILLDAGPHMDSVLKNCLWAANGVYIPVPTTFYNFDSTLRFLQRLPVVFKELVNDGLDLRRLDFIKPYISKAPTSENSQDKEVYANAQSDLNGIFSFNNTIKHDLPEEDVYERCAETGGTVFTIRQKDYAGSREAYKRAKTHAELWAVELIEGMMAHHKQRVV